MPKKGYKQSPTHKAKIGLMLKGNQNAAKGDVAPGQEQQGSKECTAAAEQKKGGSGSGGSGGQ